MDINGVQWRNAAEQSSYPFVDQATLTARNGRQLQRSVVLDALICSSELKYPIWLSSLQYSSDSIVSCELSDGLNTIAGNELQADGRMELIGPSGGYSGVVLFDKNSIKTVGPSEEPMTFDAAATTLVVSCVVPLPGNKLVGITAENTVFSGDVLLMSEQGVRLTKDVNKNIVINVYGERLKYVDYGETEPIRGIDLVIDDVLVASSYPDKQGRLVIRDDNTVAEDAIIRFEPIVGGMTVNIIGGKGVTNG